MRPPKISIGRTYFKPLVLQHSLDGSIFAAWGHFRLKHDTERAISHDLALGVLHFLGFASQAILDLFTNDLYWVSGAQSENAWNVGNDSTAIKGLDLPPMRRPAKTPGRLCDITEAV